MEGIAIHENIGFIALHKKMVKISPRILSKRLKELEAGELIRKEVIIKNHLRTQYSLTSKGKDLYQIFREIKIRNVKYQNMGIDCTKLECVNCLHY